MNSIATIQDFGKVLQIIKQKMPELVFTSITCNIYGNFVIKKNDETFVVKAEDWTVWQLKNGWRNPEWVELK
jgi:hypothetical protein